MASDHNTTPSPPNKSKLRFDVFSSSIPQSAFVRTIRNLGKFSSYYAVFTWTVLFFTLVLNRKISFLYLVAATQITLLNFVLMCMLPDLFVLHKTIDRRVVWFLASVLLFLPVVITALLLIQTGGEMFLLATHVVIMGVVVVHALLSHIEDDFVDELGEKSVDLV